MFLYFSWTGTSTRFIHVMGFFQSSKLFSIFLGGFPGKIVVHRRTSMFLYVFIWLGKKTWTRKLFLVGWCICHPAVEGWQSWCWTVIRVKQWGFVSGKIRRNHQIFGDQKISKDEFPDRSLKPGHCCIVSSYWVSTHPNLCGSAPAVIMGYHIIMASWLAPSPDELCWSTDERCDLNFLKRTWDRISQQDLSMSQFLLASAVLWTVHLLPFFANPGRLGHADLPSGAGARKWPTKCSGCFRMKNMIPMSPMRNVGVLRFPNGFEMFLHGFEKKNAWFREKEVVGLVGVEK